MQKEKKVSIVVWFLVVLAFIVVLVFINKKDKISDVSQGSQVDQNTNMPINTTTSAQDNAGVGITILQEGTGAVAKAGDTVAMNYTGKLADGTVFDSNIDPKFQHVQPFAFTIGAGQVIKGWDVGVAGMKVGEKRNLVIQPDYAYGASGAGSVIPPNAVLSFDVELLAIKQ